MPVQAVGVIPARLAATRLPNKPLIEIHGKTMIQHVWERVQRVQGLAFAVVATPDPEIFRVVEAFGGKAVMTSEAHRSGTDRVAEAARLLDLSPMTPLWSTFKETNLSLNQ